MEFISTLEKKIRPQESPHRSDLRFANHQPSLSCHCQSLFPFSRTIVTQSKKPEVESGPLLLRKRCKKGSSQSWQQLQKEAKVSQSQRSNNSQTMKEATSCNTFFSSCTLESSASFHSMDSAEQDFADRHEEKHAPIVCFASDQRSERLELNESGWTKLYGRKNEKERLIHCYEATMGQVPTEKQGFLVITGESGKSSIPCKLRDVKQFQ